MQVSREHDNEDARAMLARALSHARAALDGEEDEAGLAAALRELAAAADRLAGALGHKPS
jgi:hypothetical protein